MKSSIKHGADTLVDLPEGSYYVEGISTSKQIKLYASRSLIEGGANLEFTAPTNDGTHTFTLESQKTEKIYPSQSLKKSHL